ncbi:MAG: repressor LexA [Planctomycetaceae bacterium]
MASSSEKQPSLTRRQEEIYDFLKDKILKRGYGPTVREIGNHFGIRSPNGVMCHLKALERKGLISRESNMSRAIQLTDNSQQKTVLPLLGTAVSGDPWRPDLEDETVEFGGLFQAGNRACILVRGTALGSLGIQDGDYLIVAKGATGRPESLMAGLDDRNCLIVTRVGNDGVPSNPVVPGAVPGMMSRELGVVVGVIRRFAAADAAVTSATNTAHMNGHGEILEDDADDS